MSYTYKKDIRAFVTGLTKDLNVYGLSALSELLNFDPNKAACMGKDISWLKYKEEDVPELHEDLVSNLMALEPDENMLLCACAISLKIQTALDIAEAEWNGPDLESMGLVNLELDHILDDYVCILEDVLRSEITSDWQWSENYDYKDIRNNLY